MKETKKIIREAKEKDDKNDTDLYNSDLVESDLIVNP